MIHSHVKVSRRSWTWAGVVCITLGLATGCSVVDGIGKCGSGCPGDAEIRDEVRAAFRQHPELEAPNSVSVQTIDHVVYLTGIVDTGLQRDIATQVALQVPGVQRVVNSIGLESSR